MATASHTKLRKSSSFLLSRTPKAANSVHVLSFLCGLSSVWDWAKCSFNNDLFVCKFVATFRLISLLCHRGHKEKGIQAPGWSLRTPSFRAGGVTGTLGTTVTPFLGNQICVIMWLPVSDLTLLLRFLDEKRRETGFGQGNTHCTMQESMQEQRNNNKIRNIHQVRQKISIFPQDKNKLWQDNFKGHHFDWQLHHCRTSCCMGRNPKTFLGLLFSLNKARNMLLQIKTESWPRMDPKPDSTMVDLGSLNWRMRNSFPGEICLFLLQIKAGTSLTAKLDQLA